MSYQFTAKIECDGGTWSACRADNHSLEIVSEKPITVSRLVRDARKAGWGVTQKEKGAGWSFRCGICRQAR